MAMKEYSGPLGTFSYDDEKFQLSSDEEFLHYIGKETDGSKIRVPEGLVDATNLFKGTNIVSAPRLPESVTKADYTFMECDALVEPGVLPRGLKSARYGYSFCLELPVTPDFPSELEDMTGMFDNCPKLREAKRLPPGLKAGDYCFSNCPALEGVMELPDGLERMDGMFLNCGSFGGVEAIPASVLSAEDCLTGCESAIMPNVPDGVAIGMIMDRIPDTSGLENTAPPEPEAQASQEIVRDGSELGAEFGDLADMKLSGPDLSLGE